MRRCAKLTLMGAAIAATFGCQQPIEQTDAFRPAPKKDYGRPLPPGQLALRKIDPKDYPDFSRGFSYRAGLEQAIEYSLDYLEKPSSRRYFPYGDVTHERAVASLKRFQQVLREAKTPQELDALVRRDFEVYQSVGCDDVGTVFFTGYYTPIFDGRNQRDARFRHPLYRLPPDLVKDAEGNTLGRRNPDGSTDPEYYTRREIEEQRLLDGLEIAWLKDPFEAYVVGVQGSAKLRLENGQLWELGYAGNNGHEYTPVAKKMIGDGVINRNALSLQALMQYFSEHPDKVQAYTWQNERYVFFQERPGGPFGSINVPVIPYRTIATDKSVFPRACLAFADTNLPQLWEGNVQSLPYSSFVLDQDTGGAIRAAGRCDIFMGVGNDAEAVAGRTGAEGKLYYVFVRKAGEKYAADSKP